MNAENQEIEKRITLEKEYLKKCMYKSINEIKEFCFANPMLNLSAGECEALKIACRVGNKELVYFLLFSKEVKENIDFSNYKEKLFVYAAEDNYPEVLKMLIEGNYVKYSYMSDIAISIAIEKGNVEILDVLKKHYIENKRVDENLSNELLFKLSHSFENKNKTECFAKLIDEYLLIKTDKIKMWINSDEAIFQEIKICFEKRDLKEKLDESPRKSNKDSVKLKI